MPRRVSDVDRENGNVEHGLRLAKIRRSVGLNQEELGQKIGVDQSVISRFEKGQRKMYDDALTELAKALGVTPNDILGVNTNATQRGADVVLSRRMVQRLKEVEALPRRAQDKVIVTLELALRGAKT